MSFLPICETDFNLFVEHYTRCALWSSMTCDEDGSNSEPLDENYGIIDLHPTAFCQVQADCRKFITNVYNEKLTTDKQSRLRDGDDIHLTSDEHDLAHLAHNFWLTRNGHGAGFWDGDYPIHGDRLTEICRAFGESSLLSSGDGELQIFPYTVKYQRIIFVQGDDAIEPLRIFGDGGSRKALEHLVQWDNGDGAIEDNSASGDDDDVIETYDGYCLSYSYRLGYIGLERIIR